MTRWIIFEDSASDQHAYPVENINAIYVTSATAITVYARNPAQPNESVSDDTIAITCTSGTVDGILDALVDRLTDTYLTKFTVNNENFQITTVAWTAGA
tara:strand:- start:14396 stop:14692 length:297 start_codon:yes stop_codon:yes gene_type:complete